MKASLAAVIFAVTLPLCSASELKFATLDLQRTLAEYHKAQDVAKLLHQKEASFAKELESLRLEGKKIVEEAETFRRLSIEPVLSVTEREAKQRSFEQRLADLREFEVRYERVRTDRAVEFQTQAERMNRRVLEDVLITTRTVGEKEGFNFIFNASRLHPASGDVLFSRNVSDVTDKVLASLNAARLALPDRP